MLSSNILEDFSHENNIAKRTSSEDLLQYGFRIGRLIGEGSYCKVRSATYKGREIAVKIITRDKLSVDFSSRFLPREIKALSQIKHKNIIHIFKIFNYSRRVYIFMELVERGDLLSYIKTRGKLLEKEARHYFSQMVSALKYLHSIEIAHRDLKCENIMINNRDEIKIIDFGFCRCAVNDKGRRELSQTYCGSTAYAAPEVLQGTPYNPMMYDVWSLGCVLFIMVTGTMPFDDSNVRKMVSYQLRRHIKYPTSSNVNQCIKDLISRMLEPDVTRRATMEQISHCSWLRDEENEEDFQPSTSSSTIMKIQHKKTKTSAKHKSAASKGTQTSYSFIPSKFRMSDIWRMKKG
ncbi:testis-specific serine/threonine-protein kinase 1-like [Stegodyphus dumicola]|uniref:testis-specific serine/threonine-protein kinase 1-like n=1 Tax=Stegodyphus dumicola TaxID=202533 RepID=UPI0015B078E5|nr:testis-specific serine/threonine-protein kinase 1-like [Stegodyphus dumicola]